MKRNKLVKRMSFVLDYLNGLDINTSVSVLERGVEPLESFVDNEGDWVGKYIDTYEYFFWNFCVLDDSKIDKYEKQAIYFRMEYNTKEKFIGESHIETIIYFNKDKTVDIVGMDYRYGASFNYKIENDFKKNFKIVMIEIVKDCDLI